MLGNLLLKSPKGKTNGKSSAVKISENHKYHPDMQNVNTAAPPA